MELKPINRRSVVHCPPGPWLTALAFLAERFPKQGEGTWAMRMARGDVLGPDGEVLGFDAPYVSDRLLSYLRDVPNEVDHGLRAAVIHEDERLLVADKPHFMPVTPGGDVLEGSLLRQLQRQTGCADLQPLHRIDAETAGLVVFCKRVQDRAAYQAMFRERQVKKCYLAVSAIRTSGEPKSFEHRSRIEPDPAHFMRMREVQGDHNSHTVATLLSVERGFAAWSLEPITGKRHQLRVHMQAMGFPLLHDRIYPELLPARDRSAPLPQSLQLLAFEIGFVDPLTNEALQFSSRQRLLHGCE
jgi:tRNA pseudouridine32 synthase / 23S rRNA pseudouridine746 synthase